MTTGRVPAVGGTRTIPAPDPIARDYLLLALRLDQHVPGLVDGYFGPADLKAQVDMAQLRAPGRLADDAAALRERLELEVPEPDRRDWLDRQLRSLETQARAVAGSPLPYVEHVTRCFAYVPRRRPESLFDSAAAELDALLPGPGTVADRLEAEDAAWTVMPERVPAVVDLLVAGYRARAASLFGLPDGEDLRVSLVRDQPWSGYNWYDGGYRSRVDLNLDLPIRLPRLIQTIAHETYPGHHLEHALKEQVLVEGLGHLEASALLINTPECLVSEGLADLGLGLAFAPSERVDLLVELAPVARLRLPDDAAPLRAAAERSIQVSRHRSVLGAAAVNAALMLHADGVAHEEVRAYLVDVGRLAPNVAAKQLEFIEHPLWRTYVFVYSEGEALLDRWLEVVPEGERAARFARLLREPLTPPAIEAEIVAGS